jgi:hypothetical protein
MNADIHHPQSGNWPVLSAMPTPAKALMTMILLTLAVGMLGALGQIVIHDIIPTFFSDQNEQVHDMGTNETHQMEPAAVDDSTTTQRGDLFSEEPVEVEKSEPPSNFPSEQFIWTLKWTHIHLFGMSMIFIFVGTVTLFLDLAGKLKTWLIVLPFIGVWIDILSMWLKGYVSPAFFWLHVPGGLMFGAIFVFVTLRALKEMWWEDQRGKSI